MRWSLPTAQAMIALRVTLVNDRWDQTWSQLPPQQRQMQQERAAERRRDRRPAPELAPPALPLRRHPAPVHHGSVSKQMQNGRPTAAHPCRQPLIWRAPDSTTQM